MPLTTLRLRLAWALGTCVIALQLSAQDSDTLRLSGLLRDAAGQTLVGATVQALPSGGVDITDAEGAWKVTALAGDSLRFAYVGYQKRNVAATDLVGERSEVVLETQALDVVEVRARRQGNFTSMLDPRNVESITSTELRKAPCCNLGESFETNAAVDVSYRDAATGSRELQLLGLRGIYSDMLIEKRPNLYGLAASSALDLVPGTWIEGLQVGKGTSSVQTSSSALAGQINTELVKPKGEEPLFANLFLSGRGRVEANVHLAHEHNERHATGALLHASQQPLTIDRDQDGFYDQVGRQTATALLRHFVTTDHWVGQANLWLTYDARRSGETDEAHAAREQTEAPFRLQLEQQRVEAFAKLGYVGFARPATSLGFIGSYVRHGLDNDYRTARHEAQQNSGYFSALFSSYVFNTQHTYVLGTVGRVDDYRERYAGLNLDRRDLVAGLFGEYTYLNAGLPEAGRVRLASLIAGLRIDAHSLGGAQLLPRLNAKFDLGASTVLRASAGRAYLSHQVLAENVRLLASYRAVRLEEGLDLARGWNYGLAFAQTLRHETANGQERSGQLTIDAYLTAQLDQIEFTA